ncbi:MAG: ACT domain-containing protein, partial [Actinomycetota bacterium]
MNESAGADRATPTSGTSPGGAGPVAPGPGWLLQFTGADRPGITADLMTTLDLLDVSVQDVEQVLVRGSLTLAVAVGEPVDIDQLTEIAQQAAQSHELAVRITAIPAGHPNRPREDAVTVLGHGFQTPLSPAELAAIAGGIAAAGGNIDRIVRLARYPVFAYEFRVSGADPLALRTRLGQAAAAHRLDVALQPAGLERRAKRLVVLDVDSTLIQDEVVELLA